MTMAGENTESLYLLDPDQADGRLLMAQSLVDQHPDVAKVSHKWGRAQHHVDYRPFEKNELKLKPGVIVPDVVNNFGMVLQVDTSPRELTANGCYKRVVRPE